MASGRPPGMRANAVAKSLYPVGVLHPRVPTERIVAQRVVVRKPGGAFNFDGAGQFGAVAPLSDVNVVNAPPGDIAERVIADVEPVRIDQARSGVGRPRGGAQPEIVVQPLGDRFGRVGLQSRTLGGASMDAHLDGAQFAEAPVTGNFTGLAELLARSLLGAELEHAPVTMHGVAQDLDLLDAHAH